MFIVWLLWIIIVFGCGYMAAGSLLAMLDKGFDLSLGLNFLLYLGCALYGLPRFIKLFIRRG